MTSNKINLIFATMKGYNTLVVKLSLEHPVQGIKRKGRSDELIDFRNAQLIARYYYHLEILRERYDDILKHLQREFCISQDRIISILQQCFPDLNQLYSQRPGTKELQKIYPWFNWAA